MTLHFLQPRPPSRFVCHIDSIAYGSGGHYCHNDRPDNRISFLKINTLGLAAALFISSPLGILTKLRALYDTRG